MNLDIRYNVINNFKGNDENEIIETINTATTSKDELVLPGLGVLFELAWKDLNLKERKEIAKIIVKKVNN